ncbi:HAD-IA family hydrolase [Gracilibacillus salitolerans]|uniref:HAD-IA family hydrolase n=1 Tax=Gracilibacillus salitolerans TaxID=2663022 RepID=A0A5Q2TJU6_9BACI|nr:HAD family hydrolase [Gracilibacillus salitolerans]QGH35209.1 HAD-IA family hydrolase [Gracilibacillus salitolerans]
MKAVLFDLDGTLLDRETSINIFAEKQYNKYYNALKHIDKDLYIYRFIELDNRGMVWKDKVYQQLVKEFRLKDLTWEELLHDYVNQFRYSCTPFSNLYQMLDNIKNINFKLGMITNGKEPFQSYNISALELEDYFDIVLISEKEGIKKPNPKIFEKALKHLHVQPNESFFVGDHPENDINAANKVGMKSIWKNTDGVTCDSADFVINDLNEIPSIINDFLTAK